MIVMKFGGSSVSGAERIKHAASIIRSSIQANEGAYPIVVVSAMGDTTDWLLEAADEALKSERATTGTQAGGEVAERIMQFHRGTARDLALPACSTDEVESLLAELDRLLTGVSMVWELTRRTKDYLVSFGERLSARMVAAYLNTQGIPSRAVDAWDAGITSDSNFGAAEPLPSVWDDIPRMMKPIMEGRSSRDCFTSSYAPINRGDAVVPIVTGFIAKNAAGVITTLGRGGSDLTATLLGAALKADEIQTWKDVDGILTADPRVCPDAKPLSEVTYEEAEELAMFGAQVLHPRSMVPCRKAGVPVRVKNSYNISSAGTLIVETPSGKRPEVVAITAAHNITLIDIVSTRMLGAAGFMAHIFNQFLKWNISVDVIATSEVSVSLTVSASKDIAMLLEDVSRVADVKAHTGKAIVSIICDVSHSSAILACAFDALKKQGINVQMISQGASKVNISVLVDETQADATVRALHGAFFKAA